MRRAGWDFTFLLAVTIAAAAAPARAGVLISIDKSAQQMTVAVDGAPRWQWPVSTGKRGYDTPGGKFRTFRMEAEHFSREWDDAPMPHSIFFTKKGHAIHGYLDTRRIGRPASHGCVRLEPANAAKLFALVKREGLQNTQVVLTGNIALARRSRPVAPPPTASPPAVPPSAAPRRADAGPRPVIFPLFGLFLRPLAEPPAAQNEPAAAPPRLRRSRRR